MRKIAAIAMMFAAATVASAQATCPVSGAKGSECTAGQESQVVAASQEAEKKACCASEAKAAAVVAVSNEKSDDCCGNCKGEGAALASSTEAGCCGGCAGEKTGATATVALASSTDECGDCNEDPCCAEMGEKAKAIVAGAPAFAMVVGDSETCCPETAQKMAKEKGVAMAYKVADKTYACHEEAGKAYAAALNGYLAKITTVQYKVGDKTTQCSVTAASMAEKAECSVGYQLASFEYHCPVQTKAATIAALKAIDSVRVTYQVGEDPFNCPEIAGKVAELTGGSVVKLVGGKAAHCDVEASCYKAQAQIAAAAMALERASQG